MKAVIIGVGNQSKHQARFEGCRDYLKKELAEVGIDTGSFHLVPPRESEVFAQLRDAAQMGELVLVLPAPDPAAAGAVTGAVCEGLRLEARVDPDLAKQLARRAAQHDREWSRQEIEAFAASPAGCRRIPNPGGMVQGYAVSASRQLLLVLPAVQSELTACFGSTVRELLAGLGGGVSAQRTLRAVELGEAPIRTMLESFLRSENPRLALHSQGGECELHITAAAGTLTEAKKACDQMAHSIAEKLGPLLTSTQGEPLNQHVGRLLGKNRLTVAVAESGTEGALSAAIKAGSGHDKALAGGMNLTSDAQKAERLGVSKKLLSEAGGVSRRVAAAMAVLVRRAAKSGLGAAVTCGRSDKGDLAYVAVTDGREVWAKKLTFPSGIPPETAQTAACLQALNMLRLYAHRYPRALPGGTPVEHAAPGLLTPMEKVSAVLTGLTARARGAVTGLFSGGQSDATSDHSQQSNEEEAMELNLLQRILQKKLTKNDGVRLGILGLSLVVFIGCVIYIASVFGESHKNKGLIQDQQSAYSNSDIRPEDVEGYPSAYLPKFAALYAQNEDIAGWIKIDGTKYLDMPVVQYINNEYYERRDFTRADNQHGVAFVDYRVAQREPSDNTIIYAHNMNDGQMFGELLNYKSIEYYRTHPVISYDSVYYEGNWKIFGVVVCKKDDPDFLYHSFIDKDKDQDMVDFVTKIRERSILNTKVDVRTDDKLLTLSTCDYTFKSETGERIARFVVFARKVREGESLDVDTAGATINTNPVMPAEWYSYLKKQQEAELKKQQEAAAALANNKWLTESERSTLTAEEAKKLAESREQQAQQYLTYDEREQEDLDTMLYLIDRRRSEFKLFLDDDEKNLSLSKRISLAQERREQAEAAGLSDYDMEEAGSWAAIRELMESSGTGVLDSIINQNRLYLTPDDRGVGSVDALNKLLKQRRDEMALKADELGLKLSNYSTYEDFWAAVNNTASSAANEAALDEFIRQNSDYLSPEDKAGRTLDDLKKLLQQRKDEEAKQNADRAEQERKEYAETNAKFLNSNEMNLSKTELEKLVTERESQYNAAMSGLSDPAAVAKLQGITSWDQFSSASQEANNIQDEANKKPTNPETTDPPATDPVDPNPPATDPVDPNPPATDPVDPNPPATDPVVPNPPATDPVVPNPPATDPVVPPVTDPATKSDETVKDEEHKEEPSVETVDQTENVT